MDTIIYIIGPTGVGKTGLGTYLAGKFKGNLVSADSIQVYKGLDIISGKDLDTTSRFEEKIKVGSLSIGTHKIDDTVIWGLDLVSSNYRFHVSDFYNSAVWEIEEIRRLQRLPIVVGGSTLYVNSLLNPLRTISIRSDNKLREKLEKLPIEDIRSTLEKISPDLFQSLNLSELANKRRIIRKIEIAKSAKNSDSPGVIMKQSPLIVGLLASREVIRKRIDERVDARIESGAFEEAEQLYKVFDHLAPQIKNANGYKQLFKYLNGEYSKEESIQRWKFSEYRHAKNQMTYFKKYMNAQWFDVGSENFRDEITDVVSSILVSSK